MNDEATKKEKVETTWKIMDDAFEKLMSLDVEGLAKYKLRSLLKNYGLVDVEAVRNALEEMYGCNPTFSDLKKKLYIANANNV